MDADALLEAVNRELAKSRGEPKPKLGPGGGRIESFPPNTLGGEFSSGMSRGWSGLKETGYGAAALTSDWLEMEGSRDHFIKKIIEEQGKAAMYPSRVPSYKDVDSPSSMMSYLSGLAGAGMPQLGEALVTGIAAGAVGSALAPGIGTGTGAIMGFLERGAIKRIIKGKVDDVIKDELGEYVAGNIAKEALSDSAKALVNQNLKSAFAKGSVALTQFPNAIGLEMGSIYADTINDPNISRSDRKYAATVGGLLAGLSEGILDAYVVGKFFPGASSVTQEAIEQAKGYTMRFAKEFVKEIIKVMPAEGFTELGQTVIEEAAKNWMDPSKRENIFNMTEDQKYAMVDGMFGGLMMGGPMAFAAGVGTTMHHPNIKVRKDEVDIASKVSDLLPEVEEEPPSPAIQVLAATREAIASKEEEIGKAPDNEQLKTELAALQSAEAAQIAAIDTEEQEEQESKQDEDEKDKPKEKDQTKEQPKQAESTGDRLPHGGEIDKRETEEKHKVTGIALVNKKTKEKFSEGKVGQAHKDIMAEAIALADDVDDIEHAFLDEQGNVLSRTEAADRALVTGQITAEQHKVAMARTIDKGLASQDLTYKDSVKQEEPKSEEKTKADEVKEAKEEKKVEPEKTTAELLKDFRTIMGEKPTREEGKRKRIPKKLVAEAKVALHKFIDRLSEKTIGTEHEEGVKEYNKQLKAAFTDRMIAFMADQGIKLSKNVEGFIGVDHWRNKGGIVLKLPSYESWLNSFGRSFEVGEKTSEPSRQAKSRSIPDVIVHEVIHLADMVQVREQWENDGKEEGTKKSFIDYERENSKKRGEVLRSALPKLKGIKGVAQILSDVYLPGENEKLSDEDIGSEFTRMMVELARTGKINEFTDAVLAAEIDTEYNTDGVLTKFVQAWMDAIRSIKDMLVRMMGDDAPKELKTAFKNINEVLDRYGAIRGDKSKGKAKTKIESLVTKETEETDTVNPRAAFGGKKMNLTDVEQNDYLIAKKMLELSEQNPNDPNYFPAAIFMATGWRVGKYDKRLRLEINDKPAKLTDAFNKMDEDNPSLTLDQAIDYPELFLRYPEIKEVLVTKNPFVLNPNLQGTFSPKTNVINISPIANQPLSTILHEIQHWIQEKEDFARGFHTEGVKNLVGEQRKPAMALISVEAERIAKELEDSIKPKQEAIDILNVLKNDPKEYLKVENAIKEYQIRNDFVSEALDKHSEGPQLDAALEMRDEAKDSVMQLVGLKYNDKVSGLVFNELSKGFDIGEALRVDVIIDAAKVKEIRANLQQLKDSPDNRMAFKELLETTRAEFEIYQNVAGEQEARDVQARANLTEAQRETTPLFSKGDVPPEKTLVLRQTQETGETSVAGEVGEVENTEPVNPKAARPKKPAQSDEQKMEALAQKVSAISRKTFSGEIKPPEKRLRGTQPEFDEIIPEMQEYVTQTNSAAIRDAQQYVDLKGGPLKMIEVLTADPLARDLEITNPEGNEVLGADGVLHAIYELVQGQLAMIEREMAGDFSYTPKQKSLVNQKRIQLEELAAKLGSESGQWSQFTNRLFKTWTGALAKAKYVEPTLAHLNKVLGKKAGERVKELSDSINKVVSEFINGTMTKEKMTNLLIKFYKQSRTRDFQKKQRTVIAKNEKAMKHITRRSGHRAAEYIALDTEGEVRIKEVENEILKMLGRGRKVKGAKSAEQLFTETLRRVIDEAAEKTGLLEPRIKTRNIPISERFQTVLLNDQLYFEFVDSLVNRYISEYGGSDPSPEFMAEVNSFRDAMYSRSWTESMTSNLLRSKMREFELKFPEIAKKSYVSGELDREKLTNGIREEMKNSGVTNEPLIEQLVEDIAEDFEDSLQSAREKFFGSRGAITKNLSSLQEFLGITPKRLAEIAVEHRSLANTLGASLSDYLQSEYALPEDLASQFARVMQSELNKQIGQATESIINRWVKEASKGKDDKTKKQFTNSIDKILKLVNAGVMTREDTYNALAPSFGLPKYSHEVARNLEFLGDRIGLAGNERARNIIKQEMINEIRENVGVKAGDIYTAWYYISMLSGPSTQAVNIGASVLSIAGQIMVETTKNPLRGIRMMRVLFTDALFPAQLEARETFFTGGDSLGKYDPRLSSIVNPMEMENPLIESDWSWLKPPKGMQGLVTKLENIDKATAKLLHRANRALKTRYITRALRAADIFFYKAMQEMKYVADTGDYITTDMWDSAMTDARNEMLADGKDPDFDRASHRRMQVIARDIVEGMRLKDEDKKTAWQEASGLALNATFQNKPKGFLGALAGLIEKLTKDFPAGKLIVPFTRVAANVTNHMLEWTPWGFARYALGSESFMKEYKDQFGKTEFKRDEDILHRALIGTALMMLLMWRLGYEDKDDPYFAIYADGPRDPNRRKQMMDRGWKPHTFKWGGSYWSYLYTPMSIGLAIVGKHFDKWRDGEHEGGLTNVSLASSAAASLKEITNQSFLMGLTGLMSAVDSNNPERSLSQVFARTITTPFVPNIARQVANYVEPTVRQSEGFVETVFKESVVARYGLKPMINNFGEPVQRYRSGFPGMERFVTFEKTDDPVMNLISEKRLTIPSYSKNTHVGDRNINAEEYYYYIETAGPRIKRQIIVELNRLKSMDREQAQKRVNKIADDIKEEVRKDIRARARD